MPKVFITIFVFSFLFFSIIYSQPKRIITLGPRLTEQIFDLGAGNELIADTEYCVRPAEAVRLPKVGDVININVEKIAGLKPDLVLATDLNDLARIEKLKSLGIQVEIFIQPADYPGIIAEWVRLGNLAGKKDGAAGIAVSTRIQIDKIQKMTRSLPKTSIFFQIGSNPLFTLPSKSFMQDYISLAGGTNIASDAGIGIFSTEQVIKRNPDVIIIALMGVDGDNELKGWEKFQGLKAVQNKKIFLLDPTTACSPTPVTFAKTLKEVAGMLHPEIAGKLK